MSATEDTKHSTPNDVGGEVTSSAPQPSADSNETMTSSTQVTSQATTAADPAASGDSATSPVDETQAEAESSSTPKPVTSSTEDTPSSATNEGTSESPGSPEQLLPPSPSAVVPSRVVVVTGASSGLGFQVARVLCAGGHDVILACRDELKANRVLEKLRKETPNAQATYMHLDLADLGSVRKFVTDFQATGKQLSVLVNNAGVTVNMKSLQRQYTKDNFELMMGTNHLGHFLLTNLLLADLKRTATEGGDARIVVVTSSLHDPATSRKRGTVQVLDIDDLFLFKEDSYSGLQAYKNSKLANVLFTYELARQLGDCGVKVIAVDPGFAASTEMLRHAGGPQKFFARYVLHGLLRVTKQTRSVSQAATDVCNVALSERFKEASGKYIRNGCEVKSSDESLDESLQKKLWELSGRYTHLEGFEPLTASPPPSEPPAATKEADTSATSPPPAAAAAATAEPTATDKDIGSTDKPSSEEETTSKASEEKKNETTSTGEENGAVCKAEDNATDDDGEKEVEGTTGRLADTDEKAENNPAADESAESNKAEQGERSGSDVDTVQATDAESNEMVAPTAKDDSTVVEVENKQETDKGESSGEVDAVKENAVEEEKATKSDNTVDEPDTVK